MAAPDRIRNRNVYPLIEVICQLRFPAILRIDAQAPAQFQEAIRGDYPQFSQWMENLPPRKEGGKLVPQGTQPNYQFLAKDNQWKVNLTKNFISLSTNHYTLGRLCQAAG